MLADVLTGKHIFVSDVIQSVWLTRSEWGEMMPEVWKEAELQARLQVCWKRSSSQWKQVLLWISRTSLPSEPAAAVLFLLAGRVQPCWVEILSSVRCWSFGLQNLPDSWQQQVLFYFWSLRFEGLSCFPAGSPVSSCFFYTNKSWKLELSQSHLPQEGNIFNQLQWNLKVMISKC